MIIRKTWFCVILFLIITACTKNDVAVHQLNPSLQFDSGISFSSPVFGLMLADGSIDETKASMYTAGVTLVRVPLFLSQTTFSKTIDNYLQNGFNVQVNLNWQSTASGAVAFPVDTNFLRKQAKEFFRHYKSYASQIPVVVVENEWDNTDYHSGNISDYLKELSIIIRLAHKFGFKVTDAGITSGSLQRWTYSRLTGADAIAWRQHYYVGLNNNYDSLVNTVNNYVDSIKKADIDFINVHWYNTNKCNNGFSTATSIYKQACEKSLLICNEFGIRTDSLQLFNETVNEIKGNAVYALAYSGTDTAMGKAIRLSDDMLQLLH